MKKYLFLTLAALTATTAFELYSAQAPSSAERIRNAVERASLYPLQAIIIQRGPFTIGSRTVILAKNPKEQKEYSASFSHYNSQYEGTIKQYNRNQDRIEKKILRGEDAEILFKALMDKSNIDIAADEAARRTLFGG